MIVMSLFPPIWFWVMNRKLETWEKMAFDAERFKHVVRQFA